MLNFAVCICFVAAKLLIKCETRKNVVKDLTDRHFGKTVGKVDGRGTGGGFRYEKYGWKKQGSLC